MGGLPKLSEAVYFADMIEGLYQMLKRPHIMFYALPWLMILLVAGTLEQGSIGLYAAQQKYFSSFVFWIGPIPLPGTMSILALILVNLSLKFIAGSAWSYDKAGIHITHLGILVLLFGGIVTALVSKEGYMIIQEGQMTHSVYAYAPETQEILVNDPPLFSLPFSLSLQDFKRTYHPATNIPRSYHSDVTLQDGALSWPARIEMNAPLRYQGYTFFQSSFEDRDGQEFTILSVVWNAGRLFPYIACAIICFGMAWHVTVRLKQRKRAS